MKHSDSEATIFDPLQDCVKTVLKFYGVSVDLDGILHDIGREPGSLREDDLKDIADRMGLEYERSNTTLDSLEDILMPVIMPLKDGTFRVCFPAKSHDGAIYNPADHDAKEHLSDFIDLYDGRIYVLTVDETKTQLETDHMKRGHTLDWFWEPIVSYWPRYAEIIICSFFINLFVIALPLYTLNVYDRVVPNFAISTLIALSAGIIIALFFDFFFKTIRAYILERVAARIGTKYDYELMERMMHIKPQSMALSIGERVNIFRELQGIRDFYATRLAPTFVDVPFLFLFLLVIYMISPVLVIVPVIGAVLIFIFNMIVQIPNNRATEQYFATMQNKSTVLVESLAGMQSFKMFNAVGNRLFRWNVATTRSAEASRKSQFIRANIGNFAMTILHFVSVFVIFLGVFEIHAGNLTIGGLIACSILSSRAIAPIMGLSSVMANYRQSYDVLKTIDNIFQLPHETDTINQNAPKGPFKGRLELQNVSFQYTGQVKPALQNISLVIEPGESVGLIGRTGAGKSTLAQIISGYLDPQAGHVLLDDYALEAIPPTEFRRTIGIVPQKPYFFNGSILENVFMGREDIDEKILARAIEMSGLDLVMKQTGLGLDMVVGENGDRLSGGQQQAISLARAFVRDPQILIFDEPTTGMDNMLEARVRAALAKFIKDKTFIMVTHRTTLLPLVNRVIFMDDGKVAADGPRDDIMKKLAGQE